MQYKNVFSNKKITILKGFRLLFIPLSLIMFYFATKAWNDSVGIVLAVAFGWGFFIIFSNAITDQIGIELKTGVEQLVRKVTASPLYIEFGKAWGRMSFLIFLQEENETVTKVIYRKVVEKLKGSRHFSKIEIISMASVPDMEKETIEKFKQIMLANAVEAARGGRKER